MGIEERRDVVGSELAILARIAGEGVHLGVIHLKAAVGGNPEVSNLVGTERIDVVVDKGLSVVYGC